MKISASITSTSNFHNVSVETNGITKQMNIAPKSDGFGSSVNGGEFLLLAIATCFCNDIYREAKRRNISVDAIDIVVTGEFAAEGEPGSNFQYKVEVKSKAPQMEVDALIKYVDEIAEIHNTLRGGLDVRLR